MCVFVHKCSRQRTASLFAARSSEKAKVLVNTKKERGKAMSQREEEEEEEEEEEKSSRAGGRWGGGDGWGWKVACRKLLCLLCKRMVGFSFSNNNNVRYSPNATRKLIKQH